MVQATYGLWLARNETREGKKIPEPHEIVTSVLAYVAEWKGFHGSKEKLQKPEIKQRWVPPDEGWIKANFDGAIYKEGAKCGLGAVLRDHSGAFRAATCHFIDGVSDLEVAEIYACRRAL